MLTEAEIERLDLLQEEAGEIVQAASKIKRFGRDSTYRGPSNIEHLESEIGGLCAILSLMAAAGDIKEENCSAAEILKLATIGKYTKHQVPQEI
jgi:hypothetical protein